MITCLLNHDSTFASAYFPSLNIVLSILTLLTYRTQEEDDAPEGYFTSVEGNYIPSKWKQLYHFVQFGKAPAEWRTTFEDNDEIGAVDTESAAYMQPMSGR